MEEITSPPNGMWGSAVATEPAARITYSALIVTGPSLVSTWQVLASLKVPQPASTRVLARFSRAVTPPFSLSTTVSFQATVWAMSRLGALFSEMPSLAPSTACAMASNFDATWIKALDGMQPRIRQVPPRRSPSTRTVSMPSWPARIAAT